MTDNADLEKRLEQLARSIPPDPSLVGSVMQSIESRPAPGRTGRARGWLQSLLSPWSSLGRIPRLVTAGAFVALLAVGWQVLTVHEATAADVLARGAAAMAKLKTVAMQLTMRTIMHDNFEMIDVGYDFVPIKMWKQFDGEPAGRWRIEKPGRVVVMDGRSSVLWIKPDHAAKGNADAGFVCFLKRLLDIHRVIFEATALALNRDARADMVQVRGPDGRMKTVITMDVKAQGDFRNAYLLNKTIVEANTRRVYRFDAETDLLEGLEIFARTGTGDVLVLAITDVRCNEEIDPALFALALPPDTVWMTAPVTLPDEKYRLMGPRQMASAFFAACSTGDWNEAVKFWYATEIRADVRDYLGGLQVVSLGEPFRSGLYSGWFVPYEIRLKSGETKKHNLAVRNDNPAGRYVVDGGI